MTAPASLRASEAHPAPCVVSVFASGDLWAGAAVQVFHALRALKARSELELHAVLLNPGELKDRLEELAIDVHVFPEARMGHGRLVLEFRRYLTALRPQVVHVHDHKLQVLLMLAASTIRHRVAILRTCHSKPSSHKAPHRLKTRAFFLAERLALRRCRGIVAVSDELRRYVEATVKGVPMWTVRNGIDIPPARPPCDALRASNGIPGEACWMGTAIRLERVKNPLLLIRVAARLKREGLRFVLSVFGGGSMEATVRSEASGLGLSDVVRFHGHDPRVVETMPCWDMFLLASDHEGLPMSLLEAMASGVPPVCTAVGGIPEVIRDGDNGILVPAGDEEQFAAAVRRLAASPALRRGIAERAQRSILREFSAVGMAEQYAAIYRTCAQPR